MFLEQFPGEGRQNGWIEVICGSMFSGKTEELIRRMKRAQFANQKLVLFWLTNPDVLCSKLFPSKLVFL